MKSVHVTASRQYDVKIEAGLLDRCGEELRTVSRAQTAAVISESCVFPLYGERVIRSLEAAGFRTAVLVLPAGEASKNLENFGKILNFFAEQHLSRSDVAVALGGGVVGDITGFAASAYRRGIDYLQIPTTLLSAVDSSVGGKTAVDLATGKNLAGAFWQPVMVLCDPQVLQTLPEQVYRAGCAEVIKYGLLGNAGFFRELGETPVREQAEYVIEQCVSMKRDIVDADEFDRGQRALLNMGHTFGHAIENESGYTISHGYAVAAGMAIITRAAVKKGFCPPETEKELLRLLEKYGLPTETEYDVETLYAGALSDKKVRGSSIDLVVPEGTGKSSVHRVPVEELKDWLRCGGVRETANQGETR